MDFENKWIPEFDIIPPQVWSNSYSTLMSEQDIKLRELQFKINHKILPTNLYLHRIGRSDTNLCSFVKLNCNLFIIFYTIVKKTKSFWLEVKNWLYNNFSLILNIDSIKIVIGLASYIPIINHVVLCKV